MTQSLFEFDPARDASRLAELRPLEQRWQRRLAELKGVAASIPNQLRSLTSSPKNTLYQIMPENAAPRARTPSGISMTIGLSCGSWWPWP